MRSCISHACDTTGAQTSKSQMFNRDPTESAPLRGAAKRRPAPSPLRFWVLVALASAVIAPCVIVPVWEECRSLRLAEQVEVRAIEQMRADIQRQRLHLEGLRKDPLVVSRVARRELAYLRPDEISVPVAVGPAAPEWRPAPVVASVEPPALVTAVLRWLPFSDRVDVYVDPSARATLMGLAGATLLSAFVLFPPRRRRRC